MKTEEIKVTIYHTVHTPYALHISDEEKNIFLA